MMKKIILYTISVLFIACGSNDDPDILNDCSFVNCVAQELVFEILYKESGQNYFADEANSASELNVESNQSEQNTKYHFYANENLIRIFLSVAQTTQVEYTFSLEDRFEFTVSYEAVPDNTPGCCKTITINNLKIENIEYEEGNNDRIYYIYVDN